MCVDRSGPKGHVRLHVGGRRNERWFVLLLLLPLPPAEAGRGDPLAVAITAPAAGIVDADFVVAFAARVSDPRIPRAWLSVNGAVYPVPVTGGWIRQRVVAAPGNNRLGVVVQRAGLVARDSLTFYLRGKASDLIVLLGWPTRGEIIDLWLREPGGETCKWDHRQTRSGGRLLDFSEDAIGFGSQAYVLPRVREGRFRLKVHYWRAGGRGADRSFYSYRQMIERLDALGATAALAARGVGGPAAAATRLTQRQALLRRLDRWAAPAAPQTSVRAEAILFAGTRHERRWRFALVPQRTGHLLTLGEIEVTAAMIGAARKHAAGGTR